MIQSVLLTELAFVLTTEEPKYELALGHSAIVKLDFIISCFLPAEIELMSQAMKAWGGVPPP
jgi:hypothetical protein